MIYLVSYDIEDDKKRKKVADRLLADGLIRVQYSVFIGPLKTRLRDKLLAWLIQKLDQPESEHLIFLRLHASDLENMPILGEHSWDLGDLIGGQHTLFI